VQVCERFSPFAGSSEVPRAPISNCKIICRIVKWPPSFSLGRIQMLNNATCMKHGPCRQEPPKEAFNMVSSKNKNFFSSFQPVHGRCYLTTGPGLWPEVGRHRRCCLELRPVLCPSCRGLAPLAPEAAAAATVQSMQQGHRSLRRPRPLSRATGRLGQPLENRDSLAESQQPLCVAPSATP